MSDFLTRVAERALGLTPVLEARLPALFGPSAHLAELGGATRDIESRPAEAPGAEPTMVPPQEAAQPLASAGTVAEPGPEAEARAASEPGVPASAPRSRTRPAPRARVVAPIRHDAIVHGDEKLAERTEEFTGAPLPFAPLVPGTWSALEPARREPTAPLAAALPPARLDDGPMVHITIGRVEVRADMAPPPRERAPRVEPKPRLTLGDYLAGRRGGAR